MTSSGPVELERPRVRNASALGFCSALLGKGVARTHVLEALVICSFLRGLSVRDVEAALEECFGERVVSKSTVSRVCKDTAERYRAWCQRDLSAHDVVYLHLDAIYLKLIPAPAKTHRFGGGRRRVPDRQVLDGIFFVLRTGSQWRALDATGICNGATAHRRFQEWAQAGLFEALWEQALRDYDAELGIDWAWLSIDGSMGKARWEAGRRGANRPIEASSARSEA